MPAPIRVTDLRLERAGKSVQLSARVDSRRLGWRGARLWIRLPADLAPARVHGDPFAAGLLLVAMVSGQPLVIDAPVSPSLMANLERQQQLLIRWNWWNPWTSFQRVTLAAREIDEAPGGGAATGLFFSGGVDSMYSLRRAAIETGHEADALIFVNGYDVALENRGRTATVLEHVAGAARFARRRLLVLETNLRQFTDPALPWDMAHGAGLAFAGHAVGTQFARLLISASDSHYRDGELAGTTRDVDPLWSRDDLTFVSVGGSLHRQLKAEILAHDPCAHRHLVVCWKAPAGIPNCGRCSKCLRTMLQFFVVDALPRFMTLPHDLRPELISADSMLVEPLRIMHLQDMVERLSRRAEWAPLAERVRQLIARSDHFNRGLTAVDLTTRDGRLVTKEWLRRWLQRRMPVAVRRRLLPFYRWRRGLDP